MVREVLDTLVNPAVAITDKGIIQVFNKPAQQLWGYALTEVSALRTVLFQFTTFLTLQFQVVGKNVKMLMPEEYSVNHDTYMKVHNSPLSNQLPRSYPFLLLQNYLTTGKAKIIGTGRDVVCLLKDGSLRNVHLSISEVRMSSFPIIVSDAERFSFHSAKTARLAFSLECSPSNLR